MLVIDPLKVKIFSLLKEGHTRTLNSGLLHYGTQEDFLELQKEISNSLLNSCENYNLHYQPRNYFFTDFTPFFRLGDDVVYDSLLNMLDSFSFPIPVLLIKSDAIYFEIRKKICSHNIPVVFFLSNGNIKEIINTDKHKYLINDIKNDILSTNPGKISDLISFRTWVANQSLTRILLLSKSLDIPHPNDKNTKNISGSYYLEMQNNMLVTCYLNLKLFGVNPRFLMDAAYEIVLRILFYFTNEEYPLEEFDYILTTNNTALFLSSIIQAIIDKPLFIIDRMGPIPKIQYQSVFLEKKLGGKRVLLFEEVIATGSEVDRSILYLNFYNCSITNIIALYNLEVGTPRLTKKYNFFSLCTPRQELRYEYRSKQD